MADEKETKETPEPGPGDPLYTTPADPDAGVTKSQPNEVKPKTKEGEVEGSEAEVDYEAMTVAELKELAAQRGVEIHSDWHKADIIEALKKS